MHGALVVACSGVLHCGIMSILCEKSKFWENMYHFVLTFKLSVHTSCA
jgi:hypothetical protein